MISSISLTNIGGGNKLRCLNALPSLSRRTLGATFMKLLHTTTLIFCLSFSLSSSCQVDTTSNQRLKFRQPFQETVIKLLVGGNFQQAYRTDGKEYNRKYLEIGIHKTITAFGGHHPASSFTHGFSLEIAPEANPIYGFKYSAWAQVWCFVLSLGGVYYTDFDKGNFKIRPEIGIGMYPFKLSAGFNVPTIRNKDFKELQRAQGQVTLNILLKLKTLKRE